MLDTALPTDPGDLTVDLLNAIIAQQIPGVALVDFTVVESHQWGGGQASSAGRVIINPTYAADSPADMPKNIVVKVARADPQATTETDSAGSALYQTEVNIYTRLRPREFLEAPLALGGAFDPRSKTFLLLLEDLRDRGASFGSVLVPTSIARMRSLLDELSTLHARYWNSPALSGSLAWMEHHTKGALHAMFNHPEGAPKFIRQQVANEQFKQEMVERLGTNLDDMLSGMQLVQKHQATLAQTVCHGDTHIGNTYILPDDRGGLLDWQLTSQGHAMHDASYIVGTGLSIGDRRAHERELLAYYRAELIAKGVKDAPSAEELWTEYRRAMIWGVYIGWLTTPVVNYGWEITVMAHLRIMTAFEDLETKRLIDGLR